MRQSAVARQSGAARHEVLDSRAHRTYQTARQAPYPGRPLMAKRISIILAAIAVLVIAGGGVILASWQIPAPTKQLEKVIPNDRFAR